MASPYPKDWNDALNDQTPLIDDPDARVVVLRQLAYDMCRRGVVSYDDMSDMLELADAAREWAMMEREEAWFLGIFQEFPPDSTW
ncbi:hypothetical protein CCOS865_02242 [Pseudomonas reidholzensis]|uniref:Uncharacterized protein n=1 Tax=Pseudomonas reidholzensis TaxID=1785162 RepID=A0A383RU00_9PSED|nr:hypothetical protein [Pseudomonas reidholzensis]SYX89976.1 hypothetical protein CCOS865_02242 [Pseudomonas reidholzensis]